LRQNEEKESSLTKEINNFKNNNLLGSILRKGKSVAKKVELENELKEIEKNAACLERKINQLREKIQVKETELEQLKFIQLQEVKQYKL